MYGMGRQDSDERVGGKGKGDDGELTVLQKFTRLFSTKHHPRVARIIRYILCFLFGGLIGLIPYFIFLVELCKGLQYSCIQEYAASLAIKNVYLPSSPNGDGDISVSKKHADNLTKFPQFTNSPFVTNPVPPAIRTTLGPTRLANKVVKAEGSGNDDITLQCQGTMSVTKVFAFGVPGDKKAVTAFNQYCQANMKKVDGANVCLVSLKRVYKTQYPPFIKTKVDYTCQYYTREPA